ncbi:site-specific recombinase, partial [Psychrobacter sp. 1U2]
FYKRQDERWLANIEKDKWEALVDLLNVKEEHLYLVATAKNSILNAIVILSYRISGIGLHPNLMEAYPQILNYSASFVAQNQEAVLFVNQYRQAHELDTLTDITPEHAVNPAPLLVMLEQCEDIVATVRKRIYKTGISIRLTNMMLRLDQSLQRMRILTELVADSGQNRDKAVINL